MDHTSRAVVGLIDLPATESWSPDALVRRWVVDPPDSRGEVARVRRVPDQSQSLQHITADVVQLRRDLNELLDGFLAAN